MQSRRYCYARHGIDPCDKYITLLRDTLCFSLYSWSIGVGSGLAAATQAPLQALALYCALGSYDEGTQTASRQFQQFVACIPCSSTAFLVPLFCFSAVVASARSRTFAAAAGKEGERAGVCGRASCFGSNRKQRQRPGPPAACKQRHSSGKQLGGGGSHGWEGP